MKCIKDPNKQVLVMDCEDYLTRRLADPLCFQRNFVWGRADDAEPKWQKIKEAAEIDGEDVSRFYNINWIGNAHLIPSHMVCGDSPPRKQHISKKLRWEIWERDDFTCQFCGTRRNLSIDHIVPESKGGSLDSSNLQTLCCRCNMLKGTN